ncbi:hypothetical protein ABT030_33480 [Streptomyces mirabilis]|uniref:hypothetical protein n=1 Tax=Streptomyces mirabilis TaxID=68239 RepID=UPI0033311160
MYISLRKGQDITADPADFESVPDQPVRWWTNHAGGYYVCNHMGCSKRVWA